MTRCFAASLAIGIACTISACTATPPAANQPADSFPASAPEGASAQEPALPPDAAGAPARLADSPRHGEWAMIATGPDDSVRAWVVYPERSTPAPVVLVVHEIFGVTAWIRSVADQLAADGFIAIAPDLMTGHDVPVGADGDPVREQATATIRSLDPEHYHPQLRAIADWGMTLPAATRRYGIVGFCWGGSASFMHAVVSPDVAAAVVYYGGSPPTDQLQRISAPVLGLYAGDDERVNATVPPADAEMRRLGRPYDVHMFDGAGHGFLRQQDGRDGANMAATRGAWPLTVRFFRQHLEGEG
jgi:carboxymethylenebutenolidase